MEIPVTPSVTTTQTQQSPNQTTDVGATKTEQKIPDNVVTAATETKESNIRDDDALRRQDRGDAAGLATVEGLRVSGFKTRIDYDNEQERVFLEIIEPKTEEVLQRIPSESLIQYLSDELRSRSAPVDVGAFDRRV